MVSIEEMEVMLDEIAIEFPQEFYKELNGGIVLLPDVKLHTQSKANDLYILGEYNCNGNLGRFIAIYYGSFSRLYGYLPKDELKEKLRSTLKHEFRHHLESLSGEWCLEIEDAQYIHKYMNRQG